MSKLILILIVEIILLLLILIIINVKTRTSDFIIKTDDVPSGNKSISETYTWPCNICITADGKSKPYFSYNLSDNRCIKNNTSSYIESNIDSIQNYNIDPSTTQYESCYNDYNSMYSTLLGQFIRIYRIDGIPIKIKQIDIKDKYGNSLISNNSYIHVNPFGGYYGNTLITGNDLFTTGSPNAYVQIDLGNKYDISTITITHSSTQDSASLYDGYLVVFNTLDLEIASIVFIYKFNTYEVKRTIYIQHYLNNGIDSNLKVPISLIETFNFDTATGACTNCKRYDGKLLKNYKYLLSDYRCYKPNDYIDQSLLINSISGNIDPSINFKSCSNAINTFILQLPITDNLILWLDASDNSTIFEDYAETKLSINLGTVNVWKDKGPLKNHLKSLSGVKPILKTNDINNNNVVYLNNSFLSYTTPKLLVGYTSVSYMAVIKTISNINNSDIFGGVLDAYHTHAMWEGNKGMYLTFGYSSRQHLGTSSAVVGIPFIWEAVADANAKLTTVYFNGIQKDQRAYGSAFLYMSFGIGAEIFGYTGIIAEVIAYNKALSTTERSILRNHLKNKWKI
jgi:hypothetical protein